MKHTVETINDQKSNKKGAVGFIETALRKFKNLTFFAALFPIAVLYLVCLSAALYPGSVIMTQIISQAGEMSLLGKTFYFAFGGSLSIVCFILVLVVIVPIVNAPIRPFVKAYRGAWYSLESIPWMYHNALIYLVRYTVLNLITPSPISIFFFRAMGMKIGKNVLLNTGNISDACLIEIADYATIGGSVYLMAHYGMKGYLILDKLVIGKGANIGLHSYVMAAEVGEFSTVLPNSVVLPKTKLPANSKYGHVDGVIEVKAPNAG
jgi:acetyltransferase-like isoleucine patch superfamily enzyme